MKDAEGEGSHHGPYPACLAAQLCWETMYSEEYAPLASPTEAIRKLDCTSTTMDSVYYQFPDNATSGLL